MSWWIYVALFFVVIKMFNMWTCGICKCTKNMSGKVVVVTGANAGIGFETAKDLARRGARVILACRDNARGTRAQEKINQSTGKNNSVYKHLDLSSVASIRKFAKDIIENETRLDILINNAGAAGFEQERTSDGLITEYQINHFGPFLLTNLLLPKLKSSAPSRIINVSSIMHWLGSTDFSKLDKKTWSDLLVYSNSKLCNVYFTKELSKRLEGSGVVANCLHPGSAKSEIYRRGHIGYRFYNAFCNGVFFKSEWEGAQTTIHVAVSDQCENVSGQYFSDCKPMWLAPKAHNLEKAEKLWNLSAKLVKLDSECKELLNHFPKIK